MHRAAWILGAAGLPLSHYWLVAKVEPFYSLIYCFLWWSYIFVADFLVYRLRGRSMLKDRPWEFFVIWIWSIPAWVLFEVINLRLQNWYYVMVPADLFTGLIYLVFAFGAVLPGIFETMELIVGLVERYWPGGRIAGRPFVAHRTNVLMQMSIGLAMLVLTVAFPKSCFAMAWGFAFFFVDPLCYWRQRTAKNHIGRSLLGQLAAGDNTRFVALLAGGLICGGLWEVWNLGARTKWIYSVPYFDELKLGEMPILGFLGFPPFALECYALVNLLSYFRGGRSWELDPEENRRLSGMRLRTAAICLLVIPVCLGITAVGMIQTIGSFAEPIDRHLEGAIGPSGIEALRKRKALQTNALLRLADRPSEIEPRVWARLRQLALIAELKGIGLEKALLLEHLGITRCEELARHTPEELAAKFRQLGRFVRTEETKVWIRAARNLGS